MDRRERQNDLPTSLLAAFDGLRSQINTATPGIIQSYDASKMTCVIQPALRAKMQQPDGSWVWTPLPLLLDCPVIFPSGAGAILSFPLQKGDECLVIFASRCIDAWWQSGGINNLAELRMHDLSDGFCLPGPKSIPNVPANLSTSEVQIRNLAGTAYISLNPSSGDVRVKTNGVYQVDASSINLNGTLTINGNAYLSHKHSGIQPGPNQSGGVV